MTKELVFVHGRSQQQKDSIALKAEWIEGLKKGLARSNLTLPIPETAIRFPYYGDTLADLVNGLPAGQATDVIVRGDNADDEEKKFIQAYLEEVRKKAGISEAQIAEVVGSDVVERGPLNWGWVQGVLSAIDKFVPFGSGASIALFTKDVYQYLKNPVIQTDIDEGVQKAITPGVPAVVVSHSLGTVVAFNLLSQRGHSNGWQVPLFVTLGSPLAVTGIKRSLKKPLGHPKCAGKWFNAMDDRDVVALYPLDASNFAIDPSVENKTDVDNFTDNRHGIAGYLSDKEVARRIHEALV